LIKFKIQRGQKLLPIEAEAMDELAKLRRRLPAGIGGSGSSNWQALVGPDKANKMALEQHAALMKEWDKKLQQHLLKGGSISTFNDPVPSMKDAINAVGGNMTGIYDQAQPTDDNPEPALEIKKGGAAFRGSDPGGSRSSAKAKLGIVPANATKLNADKVKSSGLKEGDQTSEGATIKKFGNDYYAVPN
jgi:hypothetical protein